MCIDRRDFAADLVDRLGEPFDAIDRARNVDARRIADRLACVEGFEQREFVRMIAQHARPALQGGLALARIETRPAPLLETAARGRDGAIDVDLAAVGDLRDDLAVDRAHAVEGLAVSRVDACAVDHGARVDREGASEVLPILQVLTTFVSMGPPGVG